MAKFRVGDRVKYHGWGGHVTETVITRHEPTYRPSYCTRDFGFVNLRHLSKVNVARNKLERAIMKYCDAELGRC